MQLSKTAAALVVAVYTLAVWGIFSMHQRLACGRRRRTAVGIIPARYASTRFPGKALADIGGLPMVVRTYRRAAMAQQLNDVVVATDDERIRQACVEHGVPVVMTSPDCANGTERCQQAVRQLPGNFDMVVNVQGDEPLIDPRDIDAVVTALREAPPEVVYSTACTALDPSSVAHPSRVKCITDLQGHALYFSRGVLPSSKQGNGSGGGGGGGGASCAPPPSYPAPYESLPAYLMHLGLQAYDRAFLDVYCRLPATPLMLIEDLEQLKVLEHGYKMKVVMVDAAGHGVDVPEDVQAIEEVMRQRGLR